MALKFRQNLSFASESVEFTQLEMVAATTSIKTKKGKKGEEDSEVKEFKPTKDAKVEILSITLQTTDAGQQLVFRYTNSVDFTQDVAFFTLTLDGKISYETAATFTQAKALTYKPINSNFPGIEAINLERVFSQWIMSPAFASHLTVLCDMGHYTPELVKLLLLCISYLEIRDDVRVNQDGRFSKSMNVDLDLVASRFKEQMAELIEDTPRLSKFLDVSQFSLAPASEPTEENKETQLKVEVVEVDPSTTEVTPNSEEVEELKTTQQSQSKKK